MFPLKWPPAASYNATHCKHEPSNPGSRCINLALTRYTGENCNTAFPSGAHFHAQVPCLVQQPHALTSHTEQPGAAILERPRPAHAVSQATQSERASPPQAPPLPAGRGKGLAAETHPMQLPPAGICSALLVLPCQKSKANIGRDALPSIRAHKSKDLGPNSTLFHHHHFVLRHRCAQRFTVTE